MDRKQVIDSLKVEGWRFINQVLARAFPGRTLESIKYKRRKRI